MQHQTNHFPRSMADVRENRPQCDPLFGVLATLRGRVLTCTRSAVIPDGAWYGSAAFNDYRRPARVDHCLLSVCEVSQPSAIAVVCLHRGLGERDFEPGEIRLLEFFHEEIGRLIGRQLVSATEPRLDRLSPRLRQTLTCLLDGDSEKQVAARLGLSPTTVHQYVTALYRHFGVQSRGQLLAHALRRSRTGNWT